MFNEYIEYKQSLREVHTILNNTSLKDLMKIPVPFIRFIEENEDKNYEPIINFNTPLETQNLKKDTLNILSMLYLTYWCENEEQKNIFQRLLTKNEEIYQKAKSKELLPLSNQTVEEKKTNIFKRIINYLKKR